MDKYSENLNCEADARLEALTLNPRPASQNGIQHEGALTARASA